MGRCVIAGYKPKPGFRHELEKLVRAHHGILREEGLATDKEPWLLSLPDGTLIEIYEITEQYTKVTTAANPRVSGVWQLMDNICTYVPPGRLDVLQVLFPEIDMLT